MLPTRVSALLGIPVTPTLAFVVCGSGLLMTRTAEHPWTCPSCNRTVTTPHCPVCGERWPDPRELTVPGLASLIFHAFVEIDGRLIRSVRYAVTRPGALTMAFHRGQRKAYLKPIQLFFLANVIFFAMQSFTGAKIFSTPLASHLQSDIWGGLAERLQAHHIESAETSCDRWLIRRWPSIQNHSLF
jgi:hypothetical protein